MQEKILFAQMLEQYLAHVEALFSKVKDWTVATDEKATFAEESITITEESVGTYEATVLVINRPDHKTVRLLPRGCEIIGAEGRVDMQSVLGTETLVYLSNGGPTIRIDMLTENGKILMEETKPLSKEEIAEGWHFIQNRQLGMLPSLDASLFIRLLEVLGR